MAYLASLEDPNCTEGKAGEIKVGQLVVREQLSTKPQHCQIQAVDVAGSVQKWHLLRTVKGDKFSAVPIFTLWNLNDIFKCCA